MSKIAPESFKSNIATGRMIEDDIRESDPNITNEYKLKNMFYYRNEHGELVQYPITVGLDEFLKSGLGLFLYFKFLKQLMLVFLIMSICASVNCYFNSLDNGLDSWKNLNLLQKLSVGNNERITPSTGTSYTTKDIELFYDESHQQKQILTWIDFSYTLVFMLFYLFFAFSSSKDVEGQLVNEKVPATFSIGIKGIQSADKNPNDLKQFLEGLGYKIREVKYAKNYYNTLLLHKEEAELKIKIKCEGLKQKLQQESFDPNLKPKLIQQLNEKEQERKNIIHQTFGKQLKHDDYPTLMAFVIFQRISDRVNFIQEYEQNTKLSLFASTCLGKEVDQKYKYKNDVLTIIPKVDNPSNINWENLEVSTSNRLLRIIIIGFFIFCLMIITFFIVFAVNIVSKYSPENCPNKDYTYENTQLWISKASTTSEKTQIQQCFCMNQSLTDLYTSYTNYCSDIILQYTGIQVLQIASAFVILIVNSLLQLLIKNVESFERFASLSKALSGTLINLFISLFVNTALVTLILKANIYGFTLSYYLSSPIPPLQSAQQNEVFPDDFNREWYAVVGAAYINTWIINVFSPYLIDLTLYKIRVWWREKQAAKAKIQRDQNYLSVGPEFRLDFYYANLLNTVFVTLFYSSLIPLMLPLGFLAICVHFFVQKFLLLNYYKKPPSYDEALHESTMQILPISIILHILIAIWAYGQPYIFPYSATSIITKGETLSINQDSVWIRISSSSQLAILGVLFIAVLLLKYFFINPFAYLLGLCCDSGMKIDNDEKECTYDSIYSDISQYQLATYEIRENEKYKDLINEMDSKDNLRTGFNEENLPLQDI